VDEQQRGMAHRRSSIVAQPQSLTNIYGDDGDLPGHASGRAVSINGTKAGFGDLSDGGISRAAIPTIDDHQRVVSQQRNLLGDLTNTGHAGQHAGGVTVRGPAVTRNQCR